MKIPPRIVIVGAAGRLGQALADRFSHAAEVIEMTRQEIDLSEPDTIDSALEPLAFDFLILPAAMTAVDPCETHPDDAYAINAEGPKRIAEICAAKGAHMTYVSTDFVFDGNKQGAYLESDPVHPVSVYGDSKLKGEEHVLAASPKHLVVRVSWLYGPGKAAFPEWIVDKGCSEPELSLPTDKTGCPTSSVDAADLLFPLLFGESRLPASGVYHLCNSGSCTWREWGQACLDFAREIGAPVKVETISGNTLADIPAFLAKRPPNSVMDNTKFSSFTGVTPRSWQDALQAHFTSSKTFEKYQSAPCG